MHAWEAIDHRTARGELLHGRDMLECELHLLRLQLLTSEV